MTPQEILLQNKLVITMINVHHYVPHKDHGNFRQVIAAMKQITGTDYRTDCSGCISEVGRLAKVHLDAYEASLANKEATFHTFPAQQDLRPNTPTIERSWTKDETPKKKGGRPAGSKNKPK